MLHNKNNTMMNCFSLETVVAVTISIYECIFQYIINHKSNTNKYYLLPTRKQKSLKPEMLFSATPSRSTFLNS